MVREAADVVPLDERENKTNYVITLTSPTAAVITWTNGRGKNKRSHVTVRSASIDELCANTRELIRLQKEAIIKETLELERKHL